MKKFLVMLILGLMALPVFADFSSQKEDISNNYEFLAQVTCPEAYESYQIIYCRSNNVYYVFEGKTCTAYSSDINANFGRLEDVFNICLPEDGNCEIIAKANLD